MICQMCGLSPDAGERSEFCGAVMPEAKSITYTLSLTITRAVLPDNDDALVTETVEWMQGAEAKRQLERDVLRALRNFDGDCDIEVMDHKIE